MRHRRTRAWIPKGLEISEAAVIFSDPLPDFIVHRITQHLGVNTPQVAVTLRGAQGPQAQRKGEDLENWFRGVLAELDPFRRIDQRLREFQAADGPAFAELEFGPRFLPPASKEGQENKAYLADVDEARQRANLPISLSAPDPRSLYWLEARDQLKIVVKVVDKPLIDVQNNWTAQGWRLSYKSGSDRISRDHWSLGAEQPPAATAAEYGTLVRIVVIADDDWIYHCCYPHALRNGQIPSETPGAVPELMFLARYPNCIGRPPFFIAPARTTSDPDPAFHYYPLAKEVLDMAPMVNQWRTMRMIKGIMDAIKPNTYKPDRPNQESGVRHMEDIWRPGVLEIAGTIGDIPSTEIPDFDKFDKQLTDQYNSFNMSIVGMLSSGSVGSSTPAWSLLQINEEQTGFVQEAQDSRATLYREVLLAVAQAMRSRYATEAPVYVSGRGMDRRKPEVGHQDLRVGMKAEDFNLPFRLSVTIDAMTQSMRAADTEYHRRLKTEGTISEETYEENIGIQDRLSEQARKDREALAIPQRQWALNIALEKAKAQVRMVGGPMADLVLGQPNASQQALTADEQAQANKAKTPNAADHSNVLDRLKLPGQGLPLEPAQPGAAPWGNVNTNPEPVMGGNGATP